MWEEKYFNYNLSKDTIPSYFLYRDAPDTASRARSATCPSLRAIMRDSGLRLGNRLKCATNFEHCSMKSIIFYKQFIIMYY